MDAPVYEPFDDSELRPIRPFAVAYTPDFDLSEMNAQALDVAREELYLQDCIVDRRAALLSHLAEGLAQFGKAARVLEELRSGQNAAGSLTGLYDVEVAEGRDGRDVAACLDELIRQGRGGYAVLQMVFSGESFR
jgi:hypothetical protein